mgnify:CR=1 FL=1
MLNNRNTASLIIMTTLEVPINKIRIAGLTFLFAAGVLLAVLMAYYLFFDGYLSIKLVLLLLIAIPVLVFVLWTAIKKISSNKPGLVLDSRGVVDNTTLSELGILPWSNISHIDMVKYQYSYFIIIRLKNIDGILSGLKNNRLRLAKNNIQTFGTPIAINASNLKIDKFELLEILKGGIEAWNKKAF